MKVHFLRLFAATIIVPYAAFAQTATSPFTITTFKTGWNDDTFALTSNSAIANPANCDVPDSYAVNISSAGYKTHLAAALAAYMSGKQVVVVVSNSQCTFSRPTIIGIYLY